MSVSKELFINLVQDELDTIKDVATPEEISKLNHYTFNKNSVTQCIYGQMTGSCYSERAKQIYQKQYNEIYKSKFGNESSYYPFAAQSFDYVRPENAVGYTPLEKYLYMVDESKQQEIVSYLKGEIDKIDLSL